jgi:AbrB family looped-hinge helix DNA binding protein
MKSMKSQSDSPMCDFDEAFYGTATLGERGQLVIPAEARATMDMQPGDKILIMRHPVQKGLVMFKLSHARQFLEEFSRTLDQMELQQAASPLPEDATHSAPADGAEKEGI